MKRAVAVSLFTMIAATPLAQGRDFSGRWVVDVEKTAVANHEAKDVPPGNDVTIAMDTKTITVLSTTRRGLIKNVYNLDGSDSKNDTAASVGPGGRAAAPVVSKAKWQDDVLVVTTKLYSTTATSKYSMDGGRLKFEFSNPQMTPQTYIVVYKRAQ